MNNTLNFCEYSCITVNTVGDREGEDTCRPEDRESILTTTQQHRAWRERPTVLLYLLCI